MERFPNTERAQQGYINSLIEKYKQDSELSGFSEEIRRIFAIRHVHNIWPKLDRIKTNEVSTWMYHISAGQWAPEFSGILGGDLNPHCGEDATLSTTGLIGISGAAIADYIGGTLLRVDPVSYRQSLKAGEIVVVKIQFDEKSSNRHFQHFTMTGTLQKSGQRLFIQAAIRMTGANVV